jgi:hypothetical protein
MTEQTQLPSIPSKPPAADGNLGAVLEWCLRKLMQKTDGQLPCRVVSVSAKRDRVRVQPLIAMVSTAGTKVSRSMLVDVPVLSLGGGGFFINFPLKAGDYGWIEASDRDISLFLQSMNEAIPNSKRMHTFEDGRFVPDVFSTFTFAPTDGAMVVSSLDGSTRIELSPGKIAMFAAEIDINSTTLVINNAGAMTVNTATYSQNTSAAAGSTTTGKVVLPDNTTIGGTAWRGHNHHENGAGSNTNGVNP